MTRERHSPSWRKLLLALLAGVGLLTVGVCSVGGATALSQWVQVTPRPISQEAIRDAQAIAVLGGNRERVAQARLAIDQARLLTLYAAWKLDKAGALGAMTEISAIKVVAPNVLQQVVDMAIQIHGGAGMSHDTPLSAFFAQARSLRLADGPDEVHMGLIAKLEIAKRGFGGFAK